MTAAEQNTIYFLYECPTCKTRFYMGPFASEESWTRIACDCSPESNVAPMGYTNSLHEATRFVDTGTPPDLAETADWFKRAFRNAGEKTK
jgi:DNA-directed RNA polymerase subunit RPC12/RpoP